MSMAATIGFADMERRVLCETVAPVKRLASRSPDAHPDVMFAYDTPILHLVNRFFIGGAERQCVERLRLHPPGFRALVGCLEASGPLLEQVRALGHEPEVFPLRGSMLQPNTAVQVARLAAFIRAEGVRIVHASDFNTNLLALLAARRRGAKAVARRAGLGH